MPVLSRTKRLPISTTLRIPYFAQRGHYAKYDDGIYHVDPDTFHFTMPRHVSKYVEWDYFLKWLEWSGFNLYKPNETPYDWIEDPIQIYGDIQIELARLRLDIIVLKKNLRFGTVPPLTERQKDYTIGLISRKFDKIQETQQKFQKINWSGLVNRNRKRKREYCLSPCTEILK